MSGSHATQFTAAARDSAARDPAASAPWRPAKYLLWVGAVQAVGIISTLALPWATPFAFADCQVFLGVVTLPAAGLLIFFMHEDSPQWPYGRDGLAPKKLTLKRVGVVLMFTFLPGFSLLVANQALDRSAGVVESGVVLAKQIRAGRSGRIYEVAFATPHLGPLGERSLRKLLPIPDWTAGGQPVRVSSEDFARVRPGKTRVTLRVHKGLLGLPWYERESIALFTTPAPR